MPIYEYHCDNGHLYELWQGFDAETSHPCTECGSEAKRKLSVPYVAYKGEGWAGKKEEFRLPNPSQEGYSKTSDDVKRVNRVIDPDHV